MKKGTRSWILYYMIIMHFLAVIGISGIFLMFIVSSNTAGIFKLLMLLVISFLNAFIIQSMFSYINRIIRRRKRNL